MQAANEANSRLQVAQTRLQQIEREVQYRIALTQQMKGIAPQPVQEPWTQDLANGFGVSIPAGVEFDSRHVCAAQNRPYRSPDSFGECRRIQSRGNLKNPFSSEGSRKYGHVGAKLTGCCARCHTAIR